MWLWTPKVPWCSGLHRDRPFKRSITAELKAVALNWIAMIGYNSISQNTSRETIFFLRYIAQLRFL